MTKPEAKAIIRKEYLCVDRDCDIEKNCGRCDLMMPSKEPILQAYKMAIQALEQEPKTYVLDKIRAEIINKSNEPNYLHENEDWSVGLEMALEIIDKYIVKSKKKSNCSTCANANNVVVCPYTIKDIAAEEGCKFWHEPERSDKE